MPGEDGDRRGSRGSHGPQDFVRRAHEAMLKSRSTDLLTLARLALEAAIKTESDVLALLTPSPHATAKVAADQVHEAA